MPFLCSEMVSSLQCIWKYGLSFGLPLMDLIHTDVKDLCLAKHAVLFIWFGLSGEQLGFKFDPEHYK